MHVLGYFFDPAIAALAEFLDAQRADRLRRVREIADAARGARVSRSTPRRSSQTALDSEAAASAGRTSPTRWWPPGTRATATTRSIGFSATAVRRSCRASARPPPKSSSRHPRRRGHRVAGASRADEVDRHAFRGSPRAGLAALEVRHSDHDAATEERYRELAARHGLAVSGGSDFHGDHRPSRAAALGQRHAAGRGLRRARERDAR